MIAIQLPDELNQFVEKSIQSGAYLDANDFFASLVYSMKEQVDAELNEDEQLKVAALRSDVQHAAAQLDRGEGIRGFNCEAFLAERHRLHGERTA